VSTPDGPWRRWAPPAAWAALLLLSSSWPNPNPPDVRHGDKAWHFVLYAVLTLLVGRAAPNLVARPLPLAVVAVGASMFGAVDEWHQRFIPGRSASVDDWQADSAGAVLGLLLAAGMRRRITPA
jgi:VanZ family protein